jgi:hypothetical protein
MNGPSFATRQQSGKELRQSVPRSSHGDWAMREAGRDVIEILARSNEGRWPHLAPIRFGRMLRDPFAFLRGAPAVMACDLAGTPATGLAVQACGDCHLANFGLFASPERKLVFDINDFDETLRAAWEWDVKRLAASLVVAARVNGFAEDRCAEVAVRSAASYRKHMQEFAEMSPLEIWYFHIDADDLVVNAADEEARRLREQMATKARLRVGERLLPKITEQVGQRRHFVESPPLTTRVHDERALRIVRRGIEHYLQTLEDSRRCLLDRYSLEDFAVRVVGIGSVGTRCFVALLACDDRNPLLLQIKEAIAVCQPGAACGGGTTNDPGRQRYFPGMAAGPRRTRLLRAATPRHEVLGADRRIGAVRSGPLCGSLRLGVGAGARSLGRRRGDQRLPRTRRSVRPGDREVRGRVR